MTQQRISASALIQAPAQQVYAIIADYGNGHPRILPKPYFVSPTVEQGGWLDLTIRKLIVPPEALLTALRSLTPTEDF